MILLLCHCLSFAQIHTVRNPSVPQPRPSLSKEEILAGKLLDFNHIEKNYGNAARPIGISQRMVASSEYVRLDWSYTLVDSQRYFYSGNRGSHPARATGGAATISLFDSSARVVPMVPTLANTAYFYKSYLYNDKDLPVKYNGYDSTATLAVEQWHTYFPNDSVALTTLKYHGFGPLTTYVGETFYDQNGRIVRDSLMWLTIHPNGDSDSMYNVKKVFFDALGRIDYIDSSYRHVSYYGANNLATSTTKNNYSSAASLFPDSDSTIRLFHNFTTNTSDTTLIQLNDYHYNGLNQLTEATHSRYLLWPVSPASEIYEKEFFTYNSDGQIATWFNQIPVDNTWFNYSREEYQYEHNINTRYVLFSNQNGWLESLKTISTLDENYIIDSVNTYFADQRYLYTYSINNFKNLTSVKYFSGGTNGSLGLYNYRNYYYTEYDDPTAATNIERPQINLELFPNPANDILNYRVGSVGNNNFIVSIFNVAGNLLYRNNFKSNLGKINLSAFKAGVYIFEIANLDDGSSKKVKFVKGL